MIDDALYIRRRLLKRIEELQQLMLQYPIGSGNWGATCEAFALGQELYPEIIREKHLALFYEALFDRIGQDLPVAEAP